MKTLQEIKELNTEEFVDFLKSSLLLVHRYKEQIDEIIENNYTFSEFWATSNSISLMTSVLSKINIDKSLLYKIQLLIYEKVSHLNNEESAKNLMLAKQRYINGLCDDYELQNLSYQSRQLQDVYIKKIHSNTNEISVLESLCIYSSISCINSSMLFQCIDFATESYAFNLALEKAKCNEITTNEQLKECMSAAKNEASLQYIEILRNSITF